MTVDLVDLALDLTRAVALSGHLLHIIPRFAQILRKRRKIHTHGLIVEASTGQSTCSLQVAQNVDWDPDIIVVSKGIIR
jgi:hypothetical protein